MAVKRRGLGRGLDALLGAAMPPDTAADRSGEVRLLPVHQIRPSRFQPRKEMPPEALQELADSIRAQGVVQPIVVRQVAGADGYELIAGERRWRASQLAGLDDIPAVVRDVPDQSALAIALIENIQREDLNPLEEADALRRLAEEFGLTHQGAAEAVGRSRTAVTNLLRLLELPEDVKRLLHDGQLEMGHARALLGLKDALKQSEVGRQVAAKGLSVRETESLVRRLESAGSSRVPVARADPDVVRLQDELSERLGAQVRLQQGAKGKGRLIIHYNTLDELDGILAHLR